MIGETGQEWIETQAASFSTFARIFELEREISLVREDVRKWKRDFDSAGRAYAMRYAQQLENARRSLLLKIVQGVRS
jgi:hypothetical protein